MRTGRPVAKIELSAEVAGILEGYTQRRKTAQALALRARIVLACASGLSNKAVAARERVTAQGGSFFSPSTAPDVRVLQASLPIAVADHA